MKLFGKKRGGLNGTMVTLITIIIILVILILATQAIKSPLKMLLGI